MCGRFVIDIAPGLLGSLYGLTSVPRLEPRYNVAPGQTVAAVRAAASGERELVPLKWGLVPHWAKDVAIGHKLINARSETAAEKPSFREALKRRRCILPASGFYEWQAQGRQKQPFYIHRADGAPLSLAGLWECWHTPEGAPLESCSILTTAANRSIAPLHERMPVLLGPDDFGLWLDRDTHDPGLLTSLLRPAPDDWLSCYPVSTAVNRVGNDSPANLQPVTEGLV